MKAASVADLRNRFASVSRWIYEGERVAIHKRGKPFAILSPAVKKTNKAVAWPDFAARLQRQFPKGPAPGSAEHIVAYLRGEY
ncbi:MAG: prevent-host-death protein [Bdellovibrionaceae bacterium]|nr:prevent-host-death protein [Pseudobdellovibrionaceae bacterium]